MLSEKASGFLEANHHAVLSTFRKSGAAQMSIVVCGRYGDGVAFTTTEGRAKYANLVRDPRCAILVSQSDWWGYVVLEGRASVMSRHNTDAAELARALREVYRAASGREHPDWDEYDAAMARERRVAVIVVPERVYGTKA